MGCSLRAPPALWGHMVPMWGLCHTVHYNLRAERCDLWHLPAAHAARCHSLDATVVTAFVPVIFFPSQGKEDLLERRAGRLPGPWARSPFQLGQLCSASVRVAVILKGLSEGYRGAQEHMWGGVGWEVLVQRYI